MHVQVHHQAVEPHIDATIAEINSLEPLSMSWSNVADYMVAEVGAFLGGVQPRSS